MSVLQVLSSTPYHESSSSSPSYFGRPLWGPPGAPLLRALLDDATLDIVLPAPNLPLAQGRVEMLAVLFDYRDGDGRGLDINQLSRQEARFEQCDTRPAGYEASMTALHLAVRNGNADAVRFLLSRDADIDKPDYYGKTARDLALRGGHHEVVRFLEEVAKRETWCI
ncbi:hypothetical protein F4678DRAFT_458259 [Xylaria arbuscula]|nr:hypothetical protein F4678DRAFT_458259 [Xylaria arbuscula]